MGFNVKEFIYSYAHKRGVAVAVFAAAFFVYAVAEHLRGKCPGERIDLTVCVIGNAALFLCYVQSASHNLYGISLIVVYGFTLVSFPYDIAVVVDYADITADFSFSGFHSVAEKLECRQILSTDYSPAYH